MLITTPTSAEMITTLTTCVRNLTQKQDTRDTAAMQLFAVAIRENDQYAWSMLYALYSPLVLSWILKNPQSESILARDKQLNSVVNAAFLKFSRAMTDAKFAEFQYIAAVMSYLHHCATSALLDEVRRRTQWTQETSTEELSEGVVVSSWLLTQRKTVEGIESDISAIHLQNWILQKELATNADRLVFQEMILEKRPPRELCVQHPDMFQTAGEISTRKRQMLLRLRKSKTLRQQIELEAEQRGLGDRYG